MIDNKRLFEMARDSGLPITWWETALANGETREWRELVTFARMVASECVAEIESYQITVGNSAAGEIACEMTLDALREIVDMIKEQFGVEQ